MKQNQEDTSTQKQKSINILAEFFQFFIFYKFIVATLRSIAYKRTTMVHRQKEKKINKLNNKSKKET